MKQYAASRVETFLNDSCPLIGFGPTRKAVNSKSRQSNIHNSWTPLRVIVGLHQPPEPQTLELDPLTRTKRDDLRSSLLKYSPWNKSLPTGSPHNPFHQSPHSSFSSPAYSIASLSSPSSRHDLRFEPRALPRAIDSNHYLRRCCNRNSIYEMASQKYKASRSWVG